MKLGFLLLTALVGCGSNYVLTISKPMEGETIVGTEVNGTIDGTSLGDGDSIAATIDDLPVLGFHSGFTPGSCHRCFFTFGFDVPPEVSDGEHVIHVAVSKGSDELDSDDVSIVLDVP